MKKVLLCVMFLAMRPTMAQTAEVQRRDVEQRVESILGQMTIEIGRAHV